MAVVSAPRTGLVQPNGGSQRDATIVAKDDGLRFFRGLLVALILSGLLWAALGALLWSLLET